MQETIKNIIHKEHGLFHTHSGISMVTVSDQEKGLDLSKKILYEIVNSKTAFYVSGGRTPKDLYISLAKEEEIIPGSVALVDERYGKPFHEESNELMLRETGFLRYLQMRDIPFNPILHGKSRDTTATDYDGKLRELFSRYQKHIAILGVGMDGHTAGIPADPSVWEEFRIKGRSQTEMAVDFDDHGKFYNERVTMSFLALSMMDVLIVLVFGQDKKRPLEWMFADGPEDEVPSRFFKREDMAPKTILITDQQI